MKNVDNIQKIVEYNYKDFNEKFSSLVSEAFLRIAQKPFDVSILSKLEEPAARYFPKVCDAYAKEQISNRLTGSGASEVSKKQFIEAGEILARSSGTSAEEAQQVCRNLEASFERLSAEIATSLPKGWGERCQQRSGPSAQQQR